MTWRVVYENGVPVRMIWDHEPELERMAGADPVTDQPTAAERAEPVSRTPCPNCGQRTMHTVEGCVSFLIAEVCTLREERDQWKSCRDFYFRQSDRNYARAREAESALAAANELTADNLKAAVSEAQVGEHLQGIVDAVRDALGNPYLPTDDVANVVRAANEDRDRLRAALERIIRGEEEAPVGMSNPVAVARAALADPAPVTTDHREAVKVDQGMTMVDSEEKRSAERRVIEAARLISEKAASASAGTPLFDLRQALRALDAEEHEAER